MDASKRLFECLRQDLNREENSQLPEKRLLAAIVLCSILDYIHEGKGRASGGKGPKEVFRGSKRFLFDNISTIDDPWSLPWVLSHFTNDVSHLSRCIRCLCHQWRGKKITYSFVRNFRW